MLLAFGTVEYRRYLVDSEAARDDIYRESKILQEILVSMRRVYQRVFIEEEIPINDKTIRFLPAHSISRMSNEFSQLTDNGIRFRNVSDRPRNPENQADALELEAMDYFRQNPEATDRFIPFKLASGVKAYHFSSPLRIIPQCLACHGSREAAPPSISQRYEYAYDYKLGDLRGILSIKIPAQLLEDRLLADLKEDLLLKTLIFLISLVLASWLLNRIFLKRMSGMSAATVTLSKGDYSVRLPVEAKDEMASISQAFNTMAENIEQREVELRDSREAYRTVISNMEDVLFHADQDGRWEFLSPAWEQLTGNSVEHSLGQHWKKWVDVADHEHCKKLFSDLVANKDKHHAAEFRILNIDGEARYVEAISRAIMDDHQELVGITGVIRDISQRKEAEKQLQLAAKVFESTLEGVTIVDADGKILTVNSAFTDITGYSEEDVIGKNPNILKSGLHDDLFYKDMWASINKKGDWRGEIWNKRKNGEIFPVWLAINTLRDEHGQLTNYVGVFGDISVIKTTEQRLEHLAHHDPLTNLPNRLLFQLRLEHAIKQASRNHANLALLFIDLDHFKEVNDSLGHAVGDKLLQSAATLLLDVVRQDDTVARLGGDEFLVLMERIDEPQDAAIVAVKLIEKLQKPFVIDGHELFVTGSIGISIYPEQGEDVDTLIKNADAAMYRTKELGRNGFQFFSDSLTEIAQARQVLQTSLRHALERNEFRLHYQPQVALGSYQIVGMEALIRWDHPETGMVPPNQFIPFAEETGLIEPIGQWVLLEACRQAVTWQASGLPPVMMSINLSAIQLEQTDIVSLVADTLAETGLDPKYLELEITESLLMKHAEQTIGTLKALKALGVTIAIDDFGTGYSSLSYLKRFPVDKLKIDRVFICDLPEDQDDIAITRAIIALGRSLHLTLIAEGVEEPAQYQFLLDEGCDQLQGYLYSPPVPAKDMEILLSEHKAAPHL